MYIKPAKLLFLKLFHSEQTIGFHRKFMRRDMEVKRNGTNDSFYRVEWQLFGKSRL